MSIFTIAEIGYNSLRVELAGWALPIGDLDLEGTQRVEKMLAPGSPIASAQVLGPDEGRTTISGRWMDKYLGDTVSRWATINGAPAASCRALVNAVDAIRRGGNEVRVTWHDIARRGLITGLRQSWRTTGDVAWSISFEWLSQDEEEVETASEPEADGGAIVKQADPTAVEEATSALAKYLEIMDTGLAGAQRARNYYNRAEEVIGIASSAVIDPSAAAAAAASYADAIVKSTTDTAALLATRAPLTVERLDADALTSGAPGSATPLYGAGALNISGSVSSPYLGGARLATIIGTLTTESRSADVVVAAAAARVASSIFRRLGRGAASMMAEFVKRAGGAPSVTTHMAKLGQDYQSIATAYYGDRSLWRLLRSYNSDEASELEVGQVVFVPPAGVLR